MKPLNIQEIIAQEQYSFLKTNPALGDNMLFLTFGGSHAYGTNIEDSDIDIRGVALPQPKNLIGLSNFEQVIDNGTDTTIYSLNKIIGLLSSCNPNTIELLGCKPEHYVFFSDTGKLLLENKHLFLSQKAAASFGGYATSQLRRLQSAALGVNCPQEKKDQYTLAACQSSLDAINGHYQAIPEGGISLILGDSIKSTKETEVLINANLKGYPLSDYHGLMHDLRKIVKDYESISHRNRKKSDAKLNKHAMHLIRLYLMCLDILEKGEIVTFRAAEQGLLMAIRAGVYQREDGLFKDEFFELVDEFERRLKIALKETSLPVKPNYKKIEELTMEINAGVIKRYLERA